MKREQIIGIVIFVVIVVVAVVIYFFTTGIDDEGIPKAKIQLNGVIGGEKAGFLSNIDVRKRLSKEHDISINWKKAGSIEMVRNEHLSNEMDFLWPSSQVAYELFKLNNRQYKKSDIIFYSPIVIYSWKRTTDALEAKGVVEHENAAYYTVDLPALIKMIQEDITWKDIGFEAMGNKKIEIFSTDPTKSNSGFMFSGLVANLFNNESVLTEQTKDQIIPEVKKFFAGLGFLEHSSGTLFRKYIEQGIGSFPLVVGYESQIIEIASDPERKEEWEELKYKIRILYPQPTVISAHPLISLTDNGSLLIRALIEDEKLKNIAWEIHGFRTSVTDKTDVTAFTKLGLPEEILNTINMPTPVIMDEIVKTLSSNPNSMANAGVEKNLR